MNQKKLSISTTEKKTYQCNIRQGNFYLVELRLCAFPPAECTRLEIDVIIWSSPGKLRIIDLIYCFHHHRRGSLVIKTKRPGRAIGQVNQPVIMKRAAVIYSNDDRFTII